MPKGTLNLKKAVTKYSDRPSRGSPSPNFMRLTKSYLNNINDSRDETVQSSLNMSINGPLSKSINQPYEKVTRNSKVSAT